LLADFMRDIVSPALAVRLIPKVSSNSLDLRDHKQSCDPCQPAADSCVERCHAGNRKGGRGSQAQCASFCGGARARFRACVRARKKPTCGGQRRLPTTALQQWWRIGGAVNDRPRQSRKAPRPQPNPIRRNHNRGDRWCHTARNRPLRVQSSRQSARPRRRKNKKRSTRGADLNGLRYHRVEPFTPYWASS